MSNLTHNQTAAQKRRLRVRAKIKGTTARPRLSFNRSNQHIYLQLINDDNGQTLFTKTDLKITKGTKTEKSQAVAQEFVKELQSRKIKAIVVDRGSYKYHGRIKAAVEVIREAGIEV